MRRHQKAARNEVRVAEGKLARSIAHCHSVQTVPIVTLTLADFDRAAKAHKLSKAMKVL